MSLRAALPLLGLSLLSVGCQLGPGVACTEDVACSPWGHCGAQGYCVAYEEHGAASLDLSDAGPIESRDDAGEADAGNEDAGDAGEVDAGTLDAGGADAGSSDAGVSSPDAGTPTAVVPSDTSLSFGNGGLVPCDAQAPARTFTLRNDSSEDLNLTFTLSRSPSHYQVNLPGMVAMGATVQIKVTPLRVPKIADTSPDFFGETLTLRATGGTIDERHEIALHLTAQGARLTLAPFALTFSATYPAVDTQDFVIENNGNLPATISLAVNSRFSLLSNSGTLGGAQQLTRSVTFTPSSNPGVANGALQLSTNAQLCAPLPRDLVLVGNSL